MPAKGQTPLDIACWFDYFPWCQMALIVGHTENKRDFRDEETDSREAPRHRGDAANKVRVRRARCHTSPLHWCIWIQQIVSQEGKDERRPRHSQVRERYRGSGVPGFWVYRVSIV